MPLQPPSAVEKPAPEIKSLINNLEALTEEIHARAGLLSERLRPISTMPEPSPGNPVADKERSVAADPSYRVDDHIRRITHKGGCALGVINDAISRLQI
ncbi:hypothetical protein Ga0100231_005065 [Opitutaceae bacterium TAV4]|uniref:hypothetical protein n=1 Tax=Geminisphaera colitermitum TaxID=1148786 RepID=UPI000158C705|nr:hypothetical protein [Geminisphaera colitermitum]RRJ97289.1 hypothetical protein Ga0100231_001650 [Opitutaceae bacterium TAV4]RRJ97831.1 hypothetical protein Ga0100231_005065 [Opitutaceae bacterium TAV4]RRK02364.1 hypothetical protein Ga0100230_004205 [Opitutaceae bacterium TAV3]